jgi:hypothetical protein
LEPGSSSRATISASARSRLRLAAAGSNLSSPMRLIVPSAGITVGQGDIFKIHGHEKFTLNEMGEYVIGQGKYGVVLQIDDAKIELSGITDIPDTGADNVARRVEYNDHSELSQIAKIQPPEFDF